MKFNLAVILRETASATPDKAVAVYDGGRLSYGDLDALSDRLAAGLEIAGLRPGDRVGLQLPNIPQFLIAYFGILKAGGVVVPLNVLLQGSRGGVPPGPLRSADIHHLGRRARRGGRRGGGSRSAGDLRRGSRRGRRGRPAVRAADRRPGERCTTRRH